MGKRIFEFRAEMSHTTSLEEYADRWIKEFDKLLDQLSNHVQLESRLELPKSIIFWTDEYMDMMYDEVKSLRMEYLPVGEKKKINESHSGTL